MKLRSEAGKICKGTYRVASGIVTVSSAYGTKSTPRRPASDDQLKQQSLRQAEIHLGGRRGGRREHRGRRQPRQHRAAPARTG